MSSRSDVKLTVKPSRSSRRSTTGPASWRCDALSLETFGIFIASFVWVVCLTVRRADSEVLGKSNLGPGDGTLVGAGTPKSNTTVACPERAPNIGHSQSRDRRQLVNSLATSIVKWLTSM